MVHRIVFYFKEDGSVTTDASGFKGGECVKNTEKILEGLSAKVKNRILKPEYQETSSVVIKETESGCS